MKTDIQELYDSIQIKKTLQELHITSTRIRRIPLPHIKTHLYNEPVIKRAQPKDVQEFLGHSDVSTTMNVYAHATREAKRESSKLLDKVVGMN